MSASRAVSWLPGHMVKAARRILSEPALLRSVDAVLEVRDARVPLSSAPNALHLLSRPRPTADAPDAAAAMSPALHAFLAKPRVVLLNKADLADADATARVLRWIPTTSSSSTDDGGGGGGDEGRSTTTAVHAVCCKPGRHLRPQLREVLRSLRRAGARPRFRTVPTTVLIVGLPNVGKSSLINALRSYAAASAHSRAGGRAKTGALPGVTRTLSAFTIGDAVRFIDTPGLMPPRIDDAEAALRLAAVGCIREGIVPVDQVATYLCGVCRAMDDACAQRAVAAGGVVGARVHDAARDQRLVNDFRRGALGRVTLDATAALRPP